MYYTIILMYDTVICIPYRNRKPHLDYFILNTCPLFKKCMPNTKVLIIEQAGDRLFNRGKLLNVGFKEYSDKTQYLMTHDIDINPTEDTICKYYMSDISDHSVMGIYTSACNTLGGIIKFRPSTIISCNGFPNNYWGWGVEDKSIQNRCEFIGVHIVKNILNNDPLRNMYFTIFNDMDDRIRSTHIYSRTTFEYHTFKTQSQQQQKEHIELSGLNNLDYSIISRYTISDNIDHIIVDI